MENTERETKFQAAAKLFANDLKNTDDPEKLIAKRLYDFTGHVIDNLGSYAYDTATRGQDLIDSIPDMIEWPSWDIPSRPP